MRRQRLSRRGLFQALGSIGAGAALPAAQDATGTAIEAAVARATSRLSHQINCIICAQTGWMRASAGTELVKNGVRQTGCFLVTLGDVLEVVVTGEPR